MAEPLKPGKNTSEFWGKSILQVVLLLLAFGVIEPEFLQQVSPQIGAIVKAASIVTAGLTEAGYDISRGLAKTNGTGQ